MLRVARCRGRRGSDQGQLGGRRGGAFLARAGAVAGQRGLAAIPQGRALPSGEWRALGGSEPRSDTPHLVLPTVTDTWGGVRARGPGSGRVEAASMVQSPEIPEVHGIHWRRRRAMRGAEEAGMTPQSGSEHVDGRVAMSVGGDTDEATLGGGLLKSRAPLQMSRRQV